MSLAEAQKLAEEEAKAEAVAKANAAREAAETRLKVPAARMIEACCLGFCWLFCWGVGFDGFVYRIRPFFLIESVILW